MRNCLTPTPLIIDSFIKINLDKISRKLAFALIDKFTYKNPEFYKKLRLGFWIGNTPKVIEAYAQKEPFLLLPRGCFVEIKQIMIKHGFIPNPIYDRTLRLEQTGIQLQRDLRDYQQKAIDVLVRTGNGIVRGPCGSGKTVILLGAIAKLNQPTLVIVHSGALYEQWYRMIIDWFGFAPGEIRASKVNIKSITIGMQQSIWRKNNPEWRDSFGCICGDEIHRWAAKTFMKSAEMFSAKYRIGASADERRKDGKEYLIYNTFGECRFVITKKELQKKKKLVPIHLHLIPTKYYHEEYLFDRDDGITPDWQSMINDLVYDSKRNKLILKYVLKVLKNKNNKILLLNERVEFCRMFKEVLADCGVKSGCMIGGPTNQEELEITKASLKHGDLRVGIGTKVADEGLDIPSLTHVFLTCPTHTHPKRMEQMAGRSARPYKDKRFGVVYYFWDRELWPYITEEDDSIDIKLKRFFGNFRKVANKIYVKNKLVVF